MGLLDWMRPKRNKGQTHEPTAEGLYGELPKGAVWNLGPDPAGVPTDFLPDAEAYVFDIVEWRWGDEALWIEVSADSDGDSAGFGLILGLSDGNKMDAVELWEDDGRRGPVLKERQQWTIPRGHPTRELALVSHGERTTKALRRLERCFGCEPFDHPALPEKTAVICELLMLRGIVIPDEGRFTARTKIVLHEHDGWPYAEFFLSVNSVRRQIWVSEKSTEYRSAILTRISHLSTESQAS